MLNRVRALSRKLWGDIRAREAGHVLAVEFALVAALGASLALAAPEPEQLRTPVRAAAAAPAAETILTSGEAGARAEPAVLRLQDLSPDAARAWNAAVPIGDGPNPAAKPFRLKTGGVLDEARALDCMTAAVYYEAAWETTDGQRAVAQVVLNRVRHPAYPKTVCGVVFQGMERTTGCQFSFTCDGSMERVPNEAAWARARKVAAAALDGYVMKKVGNATHYHADYVAPYWSPNLHKVAVIGAHIFYRWTGGWGMPGAFSGRYAGAEMDGMKIAALDRIASPPKVELVSMKSAPLDSDPVIEAAPAPAAPSAATDAVAEAAAPLVTVADAVGSQETLVKAEELDWAGRPKKKTSRVAVPGGF